MTVYKHMPSFAGGELSPTMYGRTDFSKYDNGAAELTNFFVLRYGGISNRAGTKYVMTLPGKGVLRSFRYNSEENYMLVFTDKKVHVCYKGVPLVNEAIEVVVKDTPYAENELRLIKFTQSADDMFLTHPKHPPYVLSRYSHTDWRIKKFDIKGGPFENINTSETMITASGVTGEITLTATENFFEKDMEGMMIRLGHTVPSQYVKGVPNSSNVTTETIEDIASSGKTTQLLDVPVGYVYQEINSRELPSGYNYNAATNTITIPKQYERDEYGNETEVVESYVVKRTFKCSAGFLEVSCVPGGSVYVESFGFWKGNFSLEKYVDGNWAKIRTQSGNHSQNYSFTETNNETEIVKYRITSTEFDPKPASDENPNQTGEISLQVFSHDYYGIATIKSVETGTTASADVVKELGSTIATSDFSLSPWSNDKGYPNCCGFIEDRLVFAGSKRYGQTFWSSQSGDYNNFSTSIPTLDTDAITSMLNSGQVNGIKAIVVFGEAIMLTAGGEYKVSGRNGPLSPSNVNSQAQEYCGISDVAPVTVGSRIVYVQQQGSIVRDLGYQYEQDKYTGEDLTLLAEHLFRKHKIVSMAFQQAPYSIIWCVRDDGLLLGLTYIKEQDIYAWHKHTTEEGRFVDVACIAGEDEDELYCVVEREGKYFVEVMASRGKTDDVTEQYFVDCGKTYTGAGTKVVDGLEHLEGKTVAILADGFVMPQQVVKNGCVILSNAYKKIHVGLPIKAVFKSLPVEMIGQDGSYLSRKKRVSKVMMFFHESRGGRYGRIDESMDEMKWRSTEAWGEPIKLYSGKQDITIPSASWEKTQQIVVRQDEPLPLTILSMVAEVQA